MTDTPGSVPIWKVVYAVCQAWPAPVTSRRTRCLRSSGGQSLVLCCSQSTAVEQPTFSCTSHPTYTPPIVDRSGTHTLACSLILTRLEYCNSVLYSAPVSSIQKLQRVQNNAVRIVLQAPRRSHAKPLMRQLHWLLVQHRIHYKVSVLIYKTPNTSVPRYLASASTAASTHGHYARRLRHCSSNCSPAPTSRNVLFDALRRLSGTHFLGLSSEATYCFQI